MFTNKDIEYRTIFVINCIKDRNLRVCNGELLLEEYTQDGIFVKGYVPVETYEKVK